MTLSGMKWRVVCSLIAHEESKEKQIMAKRAAAKRQLINTGTDKRYVRRDRSGKFKESDDVSRSLAQDRRRKAQSSAKRGQGDKGDR